MQGFSPLLLLLLLTLLVVEQLGPLEALLHPGLHRTVPQHQGHLLSGSVHWDGEACQALFSAATMGLQQFLTEVPLLVQVLRRLAAARVLSFRLARCCTLQRAASAAGLPALVRHLRALVPRRRHLRAMFRIMRLLEQALALLLCKPMLL